MSASHDVDIDKHVRVYITVFVSLMALTIFTVWVGYRNLPIGQAVTVALLIASIKGGLVASYFMHLISERKLIYAVLVSTVALFAVLMLVPMLTVNDGTMVEHPGGVVHTVLPGHEGGHEGGAEGTPEAAPETAPAAAPESGAAPESAPAPAAEPAPGGAQPEPAHN